MQRCSEVDHAAATVWEETAGTKVRLVMGKYVLAMSSEECCGDEVLGAVGGHGCGGCGGDELGAVDIGRRRR